MIIAQDIIDLVLAQADIVSVIGGYTKLERKGDKYWGCCPFHHESTPSFNVDSNRKVYHCFGCKKGGNTISFLMDVERLSLEEAVKKLAKPLGIAVESNLSPQQQEQYKKINALKELYQKVQGVFEHFLYQEEGKLALDYILSRGLTRETIKLYRLGYCPSKVDNKWLFKFLRSKGYSEEFLAESGFFSKKYKEYALFTHRLTFPVITFDNEVVAFSCRNLPNAPSDSPKYINSPDTLIYNKRKMLYGLYQAKEPLKTSKQFILCEGTVDVCAMSQMGFGYSVAVLGSAFTDDQAKLIKRYADEALLLFDNDEAGKKARDRSVIILEKQEIDIKIISIENGKDAGEILQKNEINLLTTNILNAKLSFDFLLNEVYEANKVGALGLATQVCKTMFAVVLAVISPLRCAIYLEKIASRLALDLEVIKAEFELYKKQNRAYTPTKERVLDDDQFYQSHNGDSEVTDLGQPRLGKEVKTDYIKCIEKILAIFFVQSSLFRKYKEKILLYAIDDDKLSEQLNYLVEDKADFSYHFLEDKALISDEQRKFITTKVNPVWEEDLEALFLKLEKIALEKQKDELDRELQTFEVVSEDGQADYFLLLDKRTEIVKKLKNLQTKKFD